MKSLRALAVFCPFLFSSVAYGQGVTGSLTGTVTEPAGAVVANATVEARNTETGVTYPAATTTAGNYTISQLPVGTYEISVKVPGFKTYNHTNLALAAAAVLREDVTLQVGTASDSVTVNEAASLLSTENADVAHNITVNQLDSLPILGIGTAAAVPMPKIGRLSNWFTVMLWATSAFSVLNSDAASFTVTESDAVPTCRVTSSRRTAAAARARLVWL